MVTPSTVRPIILMREFAKLCPDCAKQPPHLFTEPFRRTGFDQHDIRRRTRRASAVYGKSIGAQKDEANIGRCFVAT